MKCDWQAFIKLIPPWMHKKVDEYGKEKLQELHLRIGQPPQLVVGNESIYLDRNVNDADLKLCLNAGSQYSPWSSATVSNGYITAQGGHRIGICGTMAIVDGKIQTVRNITSLCIRVSRDLPGIASRAANIEGSVLIIGSPGRGKTTLLRDLIRQKSEESSNTIAVVDERCEIFPFSHGAFGFSTGVHTDVLSGTAKADGIEIVIRTMSPTHVAVDEITAMEDCKAIVQANGCGVSILATAHAADMTDLKSRPVYQPILDAGIFQNIIIMQPDKSWKLERMNV